jgi:serine/threonine protein kinase
MELWRYGRPIEVLGGRYRLEGMLGSGGMAEVCLAWDEYANRLVAIKVLKTESLDPTDPHDQQLLNRFIKEAGQVVGWQHPHILRVYDHTQVETIPYEGQDAYLFYIVMEYASGGDLQKRMKSGEPYSSLSAAFTIVRQICGAVQYAHKQGVIHRDIKPLNILFRQPRTGPEEAVLSDFGLAVQADASHHTFAEAGTFAYMAPEQFRGKSQPASDIFALGVTLYQLCTGALPFQRDVKNLHGVLAGKEPAPFRPSELNPELPPALDAPILQALETDPAARPRSAAAFWNMLANVLADTRLPSERRAQAQATPLPYSQPLSLLTAKVNEEEEAEEPASDAEKQPTRAAQPFASPKPIVLQQAAPAPPRPRLPAPKPGRIPATKPSRAGTQALPRRQRRFPFSLRSAGMVGGILLLIVLLALFVPLLFASTVTVTLIPRAKQEHFSMPVTATQIQARQLSATAPAQTTTGPVTGTLPATKAHGELLFLNNGSVNVTIPTMTFTGKSGVRITFQGPLTIPAINPPEATTTGFAVDAGAAGNIPAFDILQYCCAPNHAIQVRNPNAFTGGQDAQPNDQIQQSDIANAANPLITSQTQSEQANVKGQVKSTERVVSGSAQCQPAVTPNAPAGTQAKTVTVTVSVTCTEQVYDAASAQTIAMRLLTQQAVQDVGAAYHLSGQATVSVEMNGKQLLLKAQGVWAYAFSSARLSQLAALIAGKSQAVARSLLLQQPGIADVRFSTTGTLPSADRIQMRVQVLTAPS